MNHLESMASRPPLGQRHITAQTCSACGAPIVEEYRDGCGRACMGYERIKYGCGRVATWHDGTFSATCCHATRASQPEGRR